MIIYLICYYDDAGGGRSGWEEVGTAPNVIKDDEETHPPGTTATRRIYLQINNSVASPQGEESS